MDTLKVTMRVNAASCLTFGAMFVVASGTVASFLGTFPPALILILGLGLVANGTLLIAASHRVHLRAPEVIFFSLGDFAWGLVTVVLIFADLWITMTAGIAVSLAVAMGVAGLGVAQLRLLGRAQHHASGSDHLQTQPGGAG